ncbi:MAG: acyl-CoA dehydrogenase [Gemmatimonadota bacterium]
MSSTSASRPIPDELLPFLPLVFVAWSDGVLSDAEMTEIQGRIDGEEGLTPEARETLQGWLDPDAPPDAASLTEIREHIRHHAASIPEEERRSLASLGIAIARAGSSDAHVWGTEAGLRKLEAIEELMGVLGREETRELLSDGPASPPARDGLEETAPAFDAAAMARYLDGEFADRRAEVHEALRTPPLRIPLGLPRDEYRERVLEAVKALADRGLGLMAAPPEWGGEGDVPGSIATFEALAYGDLSVLIKFGVQFGLFGGSILNLGTERHHAQYLEAAGRGELLGCYAMTERNHGSNVRAVETRARYLPESGEFEIHTPYPGARKDWIGNAAAHGRLATVFAQLEVDGEEHGVHALLVPIRDEGGRPSPGVTIEDCGDKVGLQGIDNGRLDFHRVRIPRENLLDRFASVTPEGKYRSSIASDGRRFFTMLGTLVTGRISIAAGSVSASKTALTVAVRYSAARRQFGPAGAPEIPILDYQEQQLLLLPRVAASYALHFAVRDLVRAYGDSGSEEERNRVDVLAAGLKSLASRHAQESIQAAREACGGRGYLAENRFGALRNDTDVFTTFEGANVVLWQLVAKGLLTQFRDDMGDMRLRGLLRFLAERASSEATRRNPVRSRRTGEEYLRDPEVQRDAFHFREQRLLETLARRMQRRIEDGLDSFDALNECQSHAVALAKANVELAVFDSFRRGVEGAPPELRAELELLADLWALSRLEADRGWFLESGWMEGQQSRAIRSLVISLCREVRERAVTLVDGFGIPHDLLDAPAAFHDPSG